MKKVTFLALLGLTICISKSANAAIVFNNISDQTLVAQGSIAIDLDGSGGPEFTFTDIGFGNVEVGIMFAASTQHLTTVSATEWDVLHGLDLGLTIDANSGFYDGGDAYIDPFWGVTMFPTVDTYIGAKFNLGGNTHFGWILVNWNGAGIFIVKSFAYETTPNTAIDAGATASQGAGVEENHNLKLQLSPNPASENLNFNTHYSIGATLEFFSLSGKLEKSVLLSTGAQHVDISNFPRGCYIVFYTSENSILKEKLVIE